MAKILNQVTAYLERSAIWLALFDWGGSILSVPKQGSNCHISPTSSKKRISSFDACRHVSVIAHLLIPLPKTASHHPLFWHRLYRPNSRMEISKQPYGCSVQMTIPRIYRRKSTRLHQMGSLTCLPALQRDTALTVSEEDVRRAVFSFPAGSFGGPDGMRPQHLKDLLSCHDSGSDLLPALTSFTNTVMAGACPIDIILIFYGGRLLAMNKKSGSIRPIAVGLTLRRLASKCANRLPSLFDHRQLGVGTPGGCEAAIHSAR